MAHHAYFFAGREETGIQRALLFGKNVLGLASEGNPDVMVYRYGLFSVDDARRVIDSAALAPVVGENKLIVLACERLFHQAQNALLKLFEEPTPGTTLVLIVPSGGLLSATLRSRLLPLPGEKESKKEIDPAADAFIRASAPEREKIVAKLLDRTKSDKDAEKQSARGEALRIVEGLMERAHDAWTKKPSTNLQLFMHDLERFIPILHERSAPTKLIFEHILLTVPAFD